MPTSDLVKYFNVSQGKTNTANERLNRLETNDSLSPVYLEDTIHASRARPGVSAPTLALRAIGAAGGVLMSVEQFSNVVQQDVYFEWHAPYNCDIATPVEFHIMWIPGAAWTVGNYAWRAECLVKKEGDTYTTGTPIPLAQDVTPTSAQIEIETIMGTISVVSEGVIYIHFYRDVASDNGDSTGDIDFFEFKYRSKKRGSKT